MAKRIVALVLIFLACTIAWVVLASTVLFRSNVGDKEIKEKLLLLWGKEQRQPAPAVSYTVKQESLETYTDCSGTLPDGSQNCVARQKKVETAVDVAVPLDRSEIQADIRYTPRRKGLYWYNTYTVDFRGGYAFTNTTKEPRSMRVVFTFPSADAQYDDFRCTGEAGKEISYDTQAGRISFTADLEPGKSFPFEVSYRSRGTDSWRYYLDTTGAYAYGDVSGQVSEARNFELVMTTDFAAIDFPTGSMSPTHKEKTKDGGWKLVWSYRKLISGLSIGMSMPEKLNPGPLASRITFFAPVSLLFFFFLLFIITVMRRVDLHPMHFFFIGASFFAFHLLFAYLVDHVQVNAAFAISAATSILLVVSYIRVVVGWRFALVETGALQLLYLVVFSYTHFFKGYTGLMVTVFAILTLFAVMQITARVKWGEVFGGRQAGPPG